MNKAFNPLDFSTAIESPIAVSLDIETSDRVSTSKILSIGATLGNILTGEVLGSFYMRIKLDGQESRSSSQDTIQFWEDQKGSIAYSEAWDQSLDRFSLKETLVQFNRFLELASQHELALDGTFTLSAMALSLIISLLSTRLKVLVLSHHGNFAITIVTVLLFTWLACFLVLISKNQFHSKVSAITHLTTLDMNGTTRLLLLTRF